MFKQLHLICLLILIVSCKGGGDVKTESANIDNSTEWTIFIYGHADHNLTPSMVVDYQEMLAANLNSRVKVILAVDLDDSRLGSSVGTEVLEILGNGNSNLLSSSSEENFDDPAVLEAHMVTAFSSFPSKKRGVILWDHGGSWDGGFGGDHQNGTVSSPQGLSIHQIKTVLQSVGSQLGLGATPFDFLSFDTCLMGNIESATELKDVAKYYFASAELDFGNGWDYTAALNLFSTSPTSTIAQLAPSIVNSWNTHHLSAGTMDLNLRSQVAFDLSKMDSFSLQISSFLTSHQPSSITDMARALMRSGPGYGIQSETQSLIEPQSYRDIGQFISLLALSTDTGMATDSMALLSSITNDVIKAQSLGDVRNGSQVGISIESRILSDWTSKKNDYLNLFWDTRTMWSGLLDDMTIAAISDGTAPFLATSAINTTNPSSVNKPTVSFSTNNSDVDQVKVILKLIQSGVEYSLGLVGYGFVEDQNVYNFDWEGKYFTLSNGTTSSLIGLGIQGSPGLNANGDVLAVGFKVNGFITNGISQTEAAIVGYEPPFSTIILIENGQLSSYQVSELAGAGLSFKPYIFKNQAPYYESMTPIPLSAGLTELQLTEESAPAGSYKLETQLSDIWKNTSSDSDSVTVVTPF